MGNGHCAHAVGIRLHHRQHIGASLLVDKAKIILQRIQIHLQPGQIVFHGINTQIHIFLILSRYGTKVNTLPLSLVPQKHRRQLFLLEIVHEPLAFDEENVIDILAAAI